MKTEIEIRKFQHKPITVEGGYLDLDLYRDDCFLGNITLIVRFNPLHKKIKAVVHVSPSIIKTKTLDERLTEDAISKMRFLFQP